jgi:PST family polysaccharide transporter
VSPKAEKPKKSKGFGERAQKGMAWSFLREGVSEVLVFPMSMVLARILTPKDFGIATAAAFFVQLAQRLSELGFNAAIVRAKVVEPIHLSTIFVVQLCMGALTFAVLAAASPFLSSFWDLPTNNFIIIAATAFLIAPFGAIPSALLQRELKFRQTTTVDWLQLFVQSVTNLALAVLGLGYMSIIYARLASVVAAMGARVYFARWRPSLTFSKAAFREIFPSGAGFFVKRLLDYSAQNGDNLVVGRVLGLTSLGLYDKAYSTMNRFLVRLNTGGPGVMFRIFAVIHQEPERFRRAYTKVMVSASMMGFPLFTILGVMAPQIMVVMFGPQWTSAATPFALLCATGALKLLNSYASAATQAAGQIWSEVTRQVTYIALIVALILVFQGWGVTGAAFGVLLATGVMTVLMHLLLQRVTHLRWSEIARPLVPALMCSAGAAAVTVGVEYLLRLALPQVNPWTLVLCQAPVAALFVAAFVLFAPQRDLRLVVAEVVDSLMPKTLRQHRWAKAYLESSTLAPVLRDATDGAR